MFLQNPIAFAFSFFYFDDGTVICIFFLLKIAFETPLKMNRVLIAENKVRYSV